MRVAISGYHNGQMVYPCVAVSEAGRGRVRVRLHWHDLSDKTNTEDEVFVGNITEAEKWLEQQGVHLDAQGIY